MWSNRAPKAPELAESEEEEGESSMPPAMPKPMWSNKPKGPPVDDDDDEDEDPPSAMPKPMWANRAPPKEVDDDNDDALPAMPKPMWSNRKPPPPQPLPPPDGASLGKASSSDGDVYRNVPVPDIAMMGASGTSLHSTGGESTLTTEAEAMDVTPTTTASGGGVATGASSVAVAPARIASAGSSQGKDKKKDKPAKHLQGQKYLYRLGGTLGKGSYAKVKECEAVDIPEELKFAVKIFKVSLLKRRRLWDSQVSGFKTAFDDVIREIAIMKKLDHPNVMTLHDVIDDPNANKLYMVMDFCPRGAIMETENMPCAPLPLADARRWFVDSVVGLSYLHFQGVVHYDLKPDNILIAGDGRAVISDFGVSRIHPNKSDTTVGSPGTPTYTAPEVWGVGGYAAKPSDVWSLGVTLHAMVFGCLPYPALNQQELIAMVTESTEWSCSHSCDEPALVALIAGMLQKVPEKRYTLERVQQDAWIASACALRMAAEHFELIQVDESELQQVVIRGHVDNFRRTRHGTLMKLTEPTEGEMYSALHGLAGAPFAAFLPKLHNLNASTDGRVLIEIEDVTQGLTQPCLMDVKMGLRTFTEADAHSSKPRKDLLEKMLKAAPDAATAEEREVGVIKLRYLQFREQSTSTRTLGFRVDAVQLDEACDCSAVLPPEQLRLVAARDHVVDVLGQYLQQRRELLVSFIEQLRQLRTTLEGSEFFATHQFIRSSILLVYDAATNATKVKMIDLARLSPTSLVPVPAADGGDDDDDDERECEAYRRLDHRSAWVEGNEEDGYLTGLDNMIDIFEELARAHM